MVMVFIGGSASWTLNRLLPMACTCNQSVYPTSVSEQRIQTIIKWDPFWGDQTMQMYGNFKGFPLYSALFGLVI